MPGIERKQLFDPPLFRSLRQDLSVSAPESSAPGSLSREAFEELLETLRETSTRFAGDEWGISAPEDVAGALRLVANLLEGGLVGHFDDDPRQPVFRQIVTSTRKSLGDNADAIYFDASVSGEHAYRIRGRTAGAVYVSFTIEVSGAGGGFPERTAGVLNDSDFDIDSEGRFEIYLGGPPVARNWVELDPEATRVTSRHYFEAERSAAVPPIPDTALEIELLEPVAPLAPPSDESVAEGFRRVARYVRSRSLEQPKPGEAVQPAFVGSEPNTFPLRFLPATMPSPPRTRRTACRCIYSGRTRLSCCDALLGVRALAFRDFVMESAAAELNRRALVPVGRFVREALAARVTAEAIQRGELNYLAPVAAFPGFPRALTDTFEELRLNAVDLAELRDCGRSGPDLARLLDAYTRELAVRGFADHAARVGLAREAAWRDAAVVTLDLAPRSKLERELLARVLGAAPSRLELQLETAGEDLVRVQPGSVEVFSTSGEALECVEIARRIHRAAGDGVPFDEIAILLRSPERHQPLVAEALRRAGIPGHFTHGTLRPDAAGRSFLALLHCAEEGLTASRFAEYLSLGQMPEEEEPPTPAVWEKLLVDAAVIGGADRWETRLHGLREEFHRRYREEQDEAERERLERRLAMLENLERLALPVIAKLAALPSRATWGAWVAALADLAEFTLREPEAVVDLLDELEPMAEIGPVGLPEVLLVLGPRLTAMRVAPKESRYGKVWIGGIEEARGLAFRRVFVPGVNEGLFSRPPAEDPLLLEAQRAALRIELRAEDSSCCGSPWHARRNEWRFRFRGSIC